MAIAALAQLDNAFPKFTGTESTDDKIRIITDYMYQQNEVIRYLLSHIGSDNLDMTSINSLLEETITTPINAEITDIENGLTNKIAITAAGLQGQISDNAGNITTLQATAEGLQTQVTNAQTTADGAVSSCSTIDQKADNIALSVSQLSTTVDGKVDANAASIILAINSGTSSATISADRINCDGITHVSDSLTIGDDDSATIQSYSTGEIDMTGYGDAKVVSVGGSVYLQGRYGIVFGGASYGSSSPSGTAPAGTVYIQYS